MKKKTNKETIEITRNEFFKIRFDAAKDSLRALIAVDEGLLTKKGRAHVAAIIKSIELENN